MRWWCAKGSCACNRCSNCVVSSFDIEEDFTYDMSPSDRRAVRKIIFGNFEYLIAEYERFHSGAIYG